MPLDDTAQFKIMAKVQAAQHVIDKGAAGLSGYFDPHISRWQLACWNFAVCALQANAVDPPSVFTDALINAGPLAATAGTAHAAAGNLLENQIRATFGNVNAYAYPPAPTPAGPPRVAALAARNGAVAQLHAQTAAVFELCLTMNGFALSAMPTVYQVCMEYEYAPTQDMYPNLTHAWLMFNRSRIIQKIPSAHISISRHHAGHPPHCGFIRRYVTDFHANQNAIIQGILENPKVIAQNTDQTVAVNMGVDITGTNMPDDEHAPAEV